ncbi:aminotransferase-like domain-containing protein [Pseudoneobacillus sp. C159]
MKVEAYFPDHIKAALKNDPPGAWMPNLPASCIRLSSGYPDPSLIPSADIKLAVARLLVEEQDLPLHYLGSPRIDELKQQILCRMTERGMAVTDSELMVTSGACQAIDLIARIFLDDQAVVAVEAPTYMEALEIFQNYTKQIISIPIDGDGLQTDLLEAVLAERKQAGLELPRFLYTIPTYQNPTGTTLSMERRKHLLQLAEDYDFFLLEDDAYGELSFGDGPAPVPLKALDQAGRVLYVGSLSKVVAPGMRIGWIAGTVEYISALSWFKKDLDHPFAQSTMATYLETVNMEERLNLLKKMYFEKCSTLVQSLKQVFPEDVSWYVPEGGYFVWVRIPGVDTSKLLSDALAVGVSFVPGKYFFYDQTEGTEYLRLSFSYADERDIVKGVQTLARLVGEHR